LAEIFSFSSLLIADFFLKIDKEKQKTSEDFSRKSEEKRRHIFLTSIVFWEQNTSAR